MLYSLKRTAEVMAADIKKYGIMIDPHARAVGNSQGVTVLDPYASSRKCRALINHYIKIAKEAEAAKATENQASLF